jgi:DNA primase
MLRTQQVAADRRMRLRVAAMPAGEDPAEMVAADGGAARFSALLEAAIELPAFQVGLVLDGTDIGSPAERDRALGEVAPVLAAMGEGASRNDLLRQVMGRVTAAQPLSGGGEQTPDPRAAAPPMRRGELTSRERRERALLAMCIALPEEGRTFLSRLTSDHFSKLGARAAAWLSENLEDPASNLPRDDAELAGLITELVIIADDEPSSPDAMDLNYMLLEQGRLEAEIAAAGEGEDVQRRAELSRERAALVEQIARAERVGS